MPEDEVKPTPAIGCGSLTLLVGVFMVLRALGAVPWEGVRGPLWLLGLGGLGAILAGASGVYLGIRALRRPGSSREPVALPPVAGWIVGGTIATILAVALGWVAFGPGERHFEEGITGSPLEGRIAFGIVAVLAFAVAALIWVRGLVRRQGDRLQAPRGSSVGPPGLPPGRPPSE